MHEHAPHYLLNYLDKSQSTVLSYAFVVAMERWSDLHDSHGFEPIAVGVPHAWTYRGQVIPANGQVTVEAVIDQISDEEKMIKASGHLSVDGLTIYEMKDFAICLAPL